MTRSKFRRSFGGRNPIAPVLRLGQYRPRKRRDRSKYRRKAKHPKAIADT